MEKSISDVGVRVAVAGGNGVPVGKGTGIEVAGKAVGASGVCVRVDRERKAAAREVCVAVTAGAQALNKNTRQERRINSERRHFLFKAIPIIIFPLMWASKINYKYCYFNHTSDCQKCPREESSVHGIIALARRE